MKLRSLCVSIIALCAAACQYPRPPDVMAEAGPTVDSAVVDTAAADAPIDGPPIDAAPIDTIDAALPIDARVVGPRCDQVPPTCGPNANDDCCATAMTVPAGTFSRAYDVAPDLYNDSSATATLSTFVLDKYEITVGRFRAFLESGHGTQQRPPAAGAGAHPNLVGSGWQGAWNTALAVDTATLRTAVNCRVDLQTWTDMPGANENKPMTCISWFEAMAFCIWDGGYLPTEAEWNYAAVGGGEHRAYPWSVPAMSTGITCGHANHDPGTPCVGRPTRVGSLSPSGDGRWGHSDLAGNVSEWMYDQYAATFVTPCSNCALIPSGIADRVQHGGSYFWSATYSRGALREAANPVFHNADRGARCARAP